MQTGDLDTNPDLTGCGTEKEEFKRNKMMVFVLYLFTVCMNGDCVHMSQLHECKK